MEPQVSIEVQVNFIPNQTVLTREIYASPQAEKEENVVEQHAAPNLTGVDFTSVPPLAFATPL